MEKYVKTLMAVLIAVLGLSLAACSSDDEPGSDIVGNWYGTRSYYNPASGTKYQELTIRLLEDGTGELEYEGPVSYSYGLFRYKVSGKKITCKGAWASTNGDFDGDFTLTLLRDGDRLLPQEMFNLFILTRDGSIVTDGDGKEVVENSDQLERVWVGSDGLSVIRFYATVYDEYQLESKNSKTYVSAKRGTYTYDTLRKILTIDGQQWNVRTLNDKGLSIERNGKTQSYKAGSESDMPTSASIKSFMTNTVFWSYVGKVSNVHIDFAFYSNGTVSYSENYKYGNLFAQGTYSVSGNKVTCNFTTVTTSSGKTSGTYSGYTDQWQLGKSCTRVYTAEIAPSFCLMLTTSSGMTLYLDPTY